MENRTWAGKVVNALLGERLARWIYRPIHRYRSGTLHFGDAMADYRVIRRWIQLTANVPGDVLELGSWRGRGTRIMANEASRFGKSVVSIDPFLEPGNQDRQRKAFMRRTRQLANHTHLPVDSLTIKTLPPLSFAFVDGDHTNPRVRHDIALAWRSLTPGGVLVVDDFTPQYPDIVAAVTEFLDREDKAIRLSDRTGVQCVIYKDPRYTRGAGP